MEDSAINSIHFIDNVNIIKESYNGTNMHEKVGTIVKVPVGVLAVKGKVVKYC